MTRGSYNNLKTMSRKVKEAVAENVDMPLGIKNYKMILVGIALIIIGFVLMAGGGSDDPNVFNPEMFSISRIVVAPLVLLAGLAFEIYAIMKK